MVVNASIFEELIARGFMAQFTHENELVELSKKKSITFYIGFDATADSLTVGHFMAAMAASHLQKAGHRPIILIGGGTTMIGDPSDRTGMRSVMTRETIDSNASIFKKQLSRFLDFSDGKAIMANNADWLLDLNYVDFLREVGIHFSINKMLSAECYKSRLEDEEKGLTFFEFNYMLMQAYDFYHLNKEYNCELQIGGNDQWSNIIAGTGLINRKLNKQAYGATFNLLTTSEGVKMGKTMKGAIWLDKKKTSPYELFQYFRNVEDSKVIEVMKLLTFIPLEEIAEYEKLEGAELNPVKEKLAYEITKSIHGEEDAKDALKASKTMFGGSMAADSIPSTDVEKSRVEEGILLVEALKDANLIKSNGEGRRLIEQNGISLNGEKISDVNYKLELADFKESKALVQKGKKVFHNFVLI